MEITGILILVVLVLILFLQVKKRKTAVPRPREVNDFFAEKRAHIKNKIARIERPLFIHNETTGLIQGKYTASDDLSKVPRTVQIAWRLYEGNKLAEARSFTIRPDRYLIPLEASAINGITTELAKEQGVPIQETLTELSKALARTDCVISHYNYFRHTIIGADYVRLGYDNPLNKMQSFDMMEEAALLLKLESNSFHSVIHAILAGENFSNRHDAAENVAVIAKAFFQLKKAYPGKP